MLLVEIFGDTTYQVKRVAVDTFEVAKFTDRKEPEVVYKVYQHGRSEYTTDSPGFHRRGQQEKHIKIVKKYLKDGEPGLTSYKIDDEGKVTSRRFA